MFHLISVVLLTMIMYIAFITVHTVENMYYMVCVSVVVATAIAIAIAIFVFLFIYLHGCVCDLAGWLHNCNGM